MKSKKRMIEDRLDLLVTALAHASAEAEEIRQLLYMQVAPPLTKEEIRHEYEIDYEAPKKGDP